jgi:hypothetical protein
VAEGAPRRTAPLLRGSSSRLKVVPLGPGFQESSASSSGVSESGFTTQPQCDSLDLPSPLGDQDGGSSGFRKGPQPPCARSTHASAHAWGRGAQPLGAALAAGIVHLFCGEGVGVG